MSLHKRSVAVLALLLFLPTLATAQQASGQEKLLKYHQALQRRPVPGYLFDRFYNSWLDASSLTELETFLRAEADKSGSSNDQLLLAFFFAEQGEEVRALEQFRLALEKDPGNASALYEKAAIEARTLDFETALNDLAQAAAANPKPEEAIKIAQLQGKLFVRNRENEKAIKIWKELIAANPKDASLMEDMIELQISEGLFDEANELSTQLISITTDPYQKVMRNLRKGDIFQRAGKRNKALEIYGESLQKVGADTWLEREILGQIEQLFRREDDLVGLNEHFQLLMKAESKRISLRKSAARLQFELGLVDESIKAFQEIIRLTPGDRPNREAFINLLSRAEKNADAVKQVESLVAQFPEDAELQIKLAELSFKASHKTKVSAAIDSFIKVSGEEEYAFLRAARLMERFDNNDKAEKIYQRAVAAFPESDSANESLAAFLYKNDKKEQATGIWKMLVEGADRSRLVRIARIASARKEHKTAFELLSQRHADFELDAIFLGQLCNEAIALKKFKEAIPWSVSRIKLCKTVGDLENALSQAVLVISRANQIENQIDQLKTAKHSNVSVACLLAELLEWNNLGQEAEDVLTQALATIDNETQDKNQLQMLWRQKVRLFKSRQDWREAAKATEQMVGLAGGRKSVNLREVVELYMRAGENESALNWISEWKKVSPGSIAPWLNQAQVNERMGRFTEATNVLRAATRKFPNDPDLYGQLAERYLNNGQYKDAERIFWRQYEESEQLSDKLRWSDRLASLSDDLGEVDALIARFEERKRNNPQSIAPLLAMAQTHRIADNYEERRMALLEATRIQKDNLPLLIEIARMEESEGNWEKAIQTLEQASKLDKTTRSRQQIARLYIQFGETRQGFARLLEIAGGKNSTARDVESVATVIIAAEEWEQARDFLLPQVSRFENDFRLRFQLAAVNLELDLLPEAQSEFLVLAKAQQEISGLNNSTPQNQYAYQKSQVEMLQRLLPPEAARILEYQLIQQMNQWGGRGRRQSFTLPTNLESCHKLAISNLLQLSDLLDEDEQNVLKQNLNEAGVGNVDLLFRVAQTLDEENADLIDEFPDNEIALAVGVLASLSTEEPNSEYGLKVFETFKEDYPGLAFIGAIQAAAGDEKNGVALTEAIELVREIEKPNMMLVTAIASFIGRQDSPFENESKVGKEHVSQLNGLLLKWYPEIQSDPAASRWVFQAIQRALQADESADRLIEFMDEQIVNASKTRSRSANLYSNNWSNRRQTLVMMPAFPPESLIAFPENVYEMLRSENPFADNDEDPEKWAEKFAGSINKARNPILRLMLQVKLAKADPNEEDLPMDQQLVEARKTLDELLRSERPNIDAYYLAACLAVSQQRFHDATNLFEKMRNLPMSREIRQKIDGHLISLATQGLVTDLQNKENQAVFKSAKSAALRLRRVRLSAVQRESLLVVFESLGLVDEAGKMEEKIAQNNSFNPGRGGRGSGSRMTAPKERVAELLDSGKGDAAARLLVQEFRGIARSSLAIDSIFDNQYEIREFEEKTRSLGLKKDFLTSLQASESSNKISILALANEVFGESDEAIKLFRQSIESNKKQDGIRLRLMLLEMKDDPQAFANHFSQVSKKSQVAFGQAIGQFVASRNSGAEAALELSDQVSRYVDVADIKNTEFKWLGTVIATIAGNLPVDRRSGDSLQHRYVLRKPSGKKENATESNESESEKKQREKTEALTARRNKIHDALASRMIGIPSVSASGFTALLASREASGDDVGEEFVEYARTAMQPVKKSARGRGPMIGSIHMLYSRDQNVIAKLRTPVEFLARHYGLSQSDHDSTIEELANQLTEWREKDQAEALKVVYGLYKSSPDEFVATARNFLEPPGTRRQSASIDARYSKIIEVWIDRQGACDITPLLLEQPTSSRGKTNFNDAQMKAVKEYVSYLAKNEKRSEAGDFLKRYRTNLLGDAAAVAELTKKMQEPAFRRGSKDRLYSGYASMINRLVQEKETIFLAIDEARILGSEQAARGIGNELANAVHEFEPGEVDAAIAWLAQSNALKDIDEFDPMVFKLENNTENSVWATALLRLSNSLNPEFRKEFVEHYKNKQETTFGEKLLVLSLNDQLDSTAKLYELIGDYLEAFKALPEEKQAHLAQFVGQIKQNYSRQNGRGSTSLTENGIVAKRLISTYLGSSASQGVEKILGAKRVSDLGIEEYRLSEWASNVIRGMDKSDPEKIVTVIAKVAKWSSRSNQNRYFSNGIHSELLESALTDIEFNSFKVVMLILGDKESEKVSISEEIKGNLAAFLAGEIAAQNKRLGKGTGGKPGRLKAFDAVYREFGEAIGQQDISCLIPVFQETMNTMDVTDLDRIEKLMSMEAADGQFKQHALAWQISAASSKASKERETSSTSNDGGESQPLDRLVQPAGYQQELLKILRNDSLTLPWRLTIAKSLLRDQTLPGECVWECVILFTEAFKTGAGIEYEVVTAAFAAMLDFAEEEQFATRTGDFAKSWLASMTKSGNEFGYSGRNKDRMIGAAVRALAKSDNRILVNQVLRTIKKGDPSQALVAVLVESGFHPEARKLCLRLWDGTSSQSRMFRNMDQQQQQTVYSKELDQAMPEFLKLFSDEDTKLLAESYFAALPDPADKSKIADKNQNARLAALASRYPDVQFRSRIQSEFTLILLSRISEFSEHIAEPLNELASKLKLDDLWGENSGVNSKNLQIVVANIAMQIRTKNFGPVQALMKEIDANDNPDGWSFQNLTERLSRAISVPVTEIVLDSTAEELEALLPLIADLNDPDSDFQLDPKVSLLAHVLAGKTDELVTRFAEFNKDKTEDDRKRLTIDPDSIWPGIFEYLESNNQLDQKEIRLKTVTDIWKVSSAIGLDCGSGHFQSGIQESCSGCRNGKFGLDAIKEHKLLSGDELAEHGAALAEMDSVDGEIWRQLGKEHLRLEQLEKAAECFKKALDASTQEMEQAMINRKIEYAFVLDKLQRSDECQKLLEKIDASQLLGDNIQRYSDLQEKLE